MGYYQCGGGSGGGGGTEYEGGLLIDVNNVTNTINFNLVESTPIDIEQDSIDNPNNMYYTQGLGVGESIAKASLTLSKSAWALNDGVYKQSIYVRRMTAVSAVVMSPDYHTVSEYNTHGIYISNQSLNSITFSTNSSSKPNTDIRVNIVYWG